MNVSTLVTSCGAVLMVSFAGAGLSALNIAPAAATEFQQTNLVSDGAVPGHDHRPKSGQCMGHLGGSNDSILDLGQRDWRFNALLCSRLRPALRDEGSAHSNDQSRRGGSDGGANGTGVQWDLAASRIARHRKAVFSVRLGGWSNFRMESGVWNRIDRHRRRRPWNPNPSLNAVYKGLAISTLNGGHALRDEFPRRNGGSVR